MKRIKGSLMFSLVLVGLFVMGSSAMAATIGIRPTFDFQDWIKEGTLKVPAPAVGTAYSLELYCDLVDVSEVTAVEGAGGIVGFSVDVDWDPLVRLDGFSEGTDYSFMDLSDQTPDKIEIDGYNFGAGIVASHVLGVFDVTCIGLGVSELMPKGRFVDNINVALGEGYLDVTFEGLTVNQVPIPSTLLLLGGGLVGLVGLKKRKRG